MRPAARLVLTLGLLAAGGAAALAAERDPAPGPARAATAEDPRLAVGRPVAPRPVGRPPRAVEVLRLRDPGSGAVRIVSTKRVVRDRGPADARELRCLDSVPLRASPRHRFAASAGCLPVRARPGGRFPTLLASSGSATGPTFLSGVVPGEVARLTVAGLGSSREVPIGRQGAWFIAVARDVRAALTITSELRDGTTRFERVRVPTGSVEASTPESPDPLDGSTWAVSASYRNGGDRRGQTCAQFFNLDRAGREAGFGPPMCGDLRRAPLFVDALRRGPGPRTKFGGGPGVAPRLVVWGAASARVRTLTLGAPGPAREIPVDADGRGFIVVLPPAVDPAEVRLRAVLTDGRTLAYPAPSRVGVSPLTRVPLRRTQRLRATVDRDRRRIVLTLGVRGRPERVKAVIEHHAVRLGAVPGRPGLYAGALRFHGPLPPRYRVGWPFAYTVICAPGCKDAEEGGTLR